MDNKKLIQGQPKFNDLSQYNFDENESNHIYENSTGLPKQNDKFQSKDLYTTTHESEINKAIIEKNLKVSGDSFIRIDELYVSSDGRDNKHNKVEAFLFSDKTLSPIGMSYTQLKSALGGIDKRFFSQNFGEGTSDIGNVTSLEGTKILYNLSSTGDGPAFGDPAEFVGSNASFGGGSTAAIPFSDSLELYELDSNIASLNTKIIEETTSNPIYFCFRLKGDKDLWIGTDVRKKRYMVYRIDNFDLFDYVGDFATGKQTEFTLDNLEKVLDVSGDGGGFGVDSPAHTVTSLKITISTIKSAPNEFSDAADYTDIIAAVESPFSLQRLDMVDIDLLSITHTRQLNNADASGTDKSTLFYDFFPLTYFSILNQNQSLESDIDLQSYYEDDIQKGFKASAPATVGLTLNFINFDSTVLLPMNGYFFVIDWDDKDNKIQTFEDWELNRPTSLQEIKSLQENDLYIPSYIENGVTLLNTHTYITPGIKTIKSIIISYDNETNQLGRWKLVTSRIFLEIPINQYPDFGELGGSDYVTIPWPYTTVAIGGVDKNSKYKKSIQDTLSGGKIGDTDIIDEKFLVNDRDNDELGQNIEQMDLEQVRYFNNGSYNMNTLLGVNPISAEGFIPYNYIVNSPNEIEDVLFSNITHNSQISNRWYGSTSYFPSGRVGTDLYEQMNYPDASEKYTIRIKYTATDITRDHYALFRYMRKDLHNTLKTYAEGGTEYTFGFKIKFNEFTQFAPTSYVFRTANRENDNGTPIHDYDGFAKVELHFYRGGDGIYNSADYNVKLANYGEWIDITKTRKLISDYESSSGAINGYPNMEFLTDNWSTNFNKKVSYENFEDIDFTVQPYIQFVWDGLEGYQVTPTSVPMPFIGVDERSEDGTNLNNSLYRTGWDYGAGYDEQINPLDEPGESATSWVRTGSETSTEPILETGLIRGKTYRFVFPTAWSAEELSDYFDDTWLYTTTTSEQILDFEITNPIMLPTEVYEELIAEGSFDILRQDEIYWDGQTNKYSEETSVGQIFIGDNSDLNLKQSCNLELNTGNLTGKSILDTSGNSNKGLLIGDYKVKKERKGEPMRRDSFIKIPKKTSNTNGAL